MESNKQQSKRANSALSITNEQFENVVKNGGKCLYQIYLAYYKAKDKTRQMRRFRPKYDVNF